MDSIEVSADSSLLKGKHFTATRHEDGSWEITRDTPIERRAILVHPDEVAEFQTIAKLLGLAR